ncbi:MAG: HAMP domain-containing histidine kinase [Bacteroidales bacterium]|nr:HAMP domain-containing histidine kinase [Bacteroidales bacterium]
MSLVWEQKSKLKIKSIIRNIIVITLITTQLTYILYLVKENKEYEEMSWFANVIGDESDKDFENAILEAAEKLKNDNNIITWQKKNEFPSDDSILNYFNEKYFNTDEIKDYYKAVTLCDTSTILILETLNDYELNCNDLFNEILEINHTKKISNELTLVDDPTTDSYYILKLNLSPIDSNHLNICYIEFYKEYILNNIGIPEIITSSENVILPKLVNYSFSCYKENILQYKYGRYNYPNELDNFRYKDEEYVKTRIFKHLIKNIDENKTIIITIEKPRFIDVIAPFSYIFIILTLMYLLNLKLHRKQEIIDYHQTLHAKMQLTIILTLGLSFIVAGITSFIFMRNSLNRKTFEFQYEKNKSIVKNLENDFGKKSITEYDYLKNYKENNFIDINIYDLNGYLINTTQPKLFEGFKSKIINRKAYESIKLKNRFHYSCEEKIDRTIYNSSYFPLKDKEGNTQAIINIPYFDNNMESKINMSNFIITYLNIILVLMGASALVVILVTRNTIKPLKTIQDKMQRISLTGKNEEIEWNSKDEIGDLIKIYNNLIKELEISANKLMRSERETAWREMARQVAHEIKNPLTPMKLNIQFLQMAWNEKDPNIDKKLRETTNTLLEQIDILSNIATAFSNYAKLPQKNTSIFNIKDLIINTINLYDNNPNINITFKEENESDYIIESDKNNLSIVFGNIIKNAIQAIGKKEDGNILIKIKDVKEYYNIEISDNGCGIRDEEKKKIFMPNFTTKSSGMGVGLSIVYDILETLESTISFESEVGKGTIFTINIKK